MTAPHEWRQADYTSFMLSEAISETERTHGSSRARNRTLLNNAEHAEPYSLEQRPQEKDGFLSGSGSDFDLS